MLNIKEHTRYIYSSEYRHDNKYDVQPNFIQPSFILIHQINKNEH